MNIRYANDSDYEFLKMKDKHLPQKFIYKKLNDQELILLLDDQDERIGWLRFGYFWDNIPFMNLLHINDDFRSKGYGRELVIFWEIEMKAKGCNLIMTSTQVDEEAQHFYRKLGYKDAGCLILDDQAMEMILTKKI